METLLTFLVEDVEYALNEALKRGAEQLSGIKENDLEGTTYKTAASSQQEHCFL